MPEYIGNIELNKIYPLGYQFIGIEKEEEYVNIAEKRLSQEVL